MSYNGSGTFEINSFGQPVVAGELIEASVFNLFTADIAQGLSTALTKDGQTTTTVRIPFAQGIMSSLVTDSSSTSTGSILTLGGIGIAKSAYIGGNLNLTGHATLEGVTSTGATGTGKFVFDTSPTLVTPTLGVASATSINKLAITAPATAATLTIADGASLITSGAYAITLTATAATGITLPTTGTLATLAGAEELTNKTLNASVGKGTWTASGTWTLPALTLGGTVSGGGNQINNVVIGASTPLAGSFTSLTGESGVFRKDQNADTNILIRNDTTGTAAQSILRVSYGDYTQYVALASISPGFTSDGLLANNSTVLFSNGTASTGFHVFTYDNKPLVLGVNNTAVLTATSSALTTGSGITSLAFSAGNPSLSIGTGALTAGAGTFSGDITRSASSSGANNDVWSKNTSNTANSGARFIAQNGGSSGGAAAFIVDVPGGFGTFHFGAIGTTANTAYIGVGAMPGTTPILSLTSSGLAVTGAGTFSGTITGQQGAGGAGTSPKIGQISDGTTYTGVSVNGDLTINSIMGMFGRVNAGEALYINTPSGYSVNTTIGGTQVTKISSTGLAVTGTLSATGAITSDGGLQTFGANDSGGSGYRLVRVPNI